MEYRAVAVVNRKAKCPARFLALGCRIAIRDRMLTEGININTLAQNDPHRLGVCGAATCGYTGGATLNANLYRQYLGWSSIAPMELSANSNYNSLQVAVRATAWKNLTFNS